VEANKDILIFLISQRAVGSEGHRRRGDLPRLGQARKWRNAVWRYGAESGGMGGSRVL